MFEIYISLHYDTQMEESKIKFIVQSQFYKAPLGEIFFLYLDQ
jgi:hypothetical protein